jgi:hypothetical protein
LPTGESIPHDTVELRATADPAGVSQAPAEIPDTSNENHYDSTITGHEPQHDVEDTIYDDTADGAATSPHQLTTIDDTTGEEFYDDVLIVGRTDVDQPAPFSLPTYANNPYKYAQESSTRSQDEMLYRNRMSMHDDNRDSMIYDDTAPTSMPPNVSSFQKYQNKFWKKKRTGLGIQLRQ